MARQPSLAEARRRYAEELRVVGHVDDRRVVGAFAAEPRERFVSPGPWHILNMAEDYWTMPDDDPRWPCHSVLEALPADGVWNVIIAFASATALHKAPVDALADRSQALIPPAGAERGGLPSRHDRRDEAFAARSASWIGICPCAGGRVDGEAQAVERAMADAAGQCALRSLRRGTHDADEPCWLHRGGWCLSKRELH